MSAEANDKKRFIRIRGANENNLKILASIFPETSLWYLPDSAAPVSHLCI